MTLNIELTLAGSENYLCHVINSLGTMCRNEGRAQFIKDKYLAMKYTTEKNKERILLESERLCSGCGLFERWYSGCGLSERWCSGCGLSERWCSGCGLSERWCSGCGLSERWCSGCGLSERCYMGVFYLKCGIVGVVYLKEGVVGVVCLKGVGRWGEVCRNREDCLQEWNGRNVCKEDTYGVTCIR